MWKKNNETEKEESRREWQGRKKA